MVVAALLLAYALLCGVGGALHDADENRTRQQAAAAVRNVPARGSHVALRAMTFNIWLSGTQVNDGLAKIVAAIRHVNPDFVCIQELQTPETLDELLEQLGSPWTGVFRGAIDYPDDAIISKHQVSINDSFSLNTAVGVRLQLADGRQVSVVGVHLAWRSYGPYAAQNKLVTREAQFDAGETTPDVENRVENMRELFACETFQEWLFESDRVPLIVAGDFNEPSHLDWTESTKSLHGGWVYAWPATKMLADAGFIDAYRHRYANPQEYPGYTWSTVQKAQSAEWNYTIPEPQDRIDFVFYKHPQLDIADAYTYAGNKTLVPIPNHANNTWPSDHYSVVVDFTNKLLP